MTNLIAPRRRTFVSTLAVPAVSSLAVPAVAMLLLAGLSGCADAKRALGFEKAPPDEFQVVERAPLAMPPEFGLRPPAPGAVRPQEGSTTDQARRIMTGTRSHTPISTQNRSQGDLALLKKAGAENIQPDIRMLVNKETLQMADADRSFTDRLVFWRKAEPVGDVVDAAKETQRLRENQALGRAVTEGETPKIERRRRGMLEGVFR